MLLFLTLAIWCIAGVALLIVLFGGEDLSEIKASCFIAGASLIITSVLGILFGRETVRNEAVKLGHARWAVEIKDGKPVNKTVFEWNTLPPKKEIQ